MLPFPHQCLSQDVRRFLAIKHFWDPLAGLAGRNSAAPTDLDIHLASVGAGAAGTAVSDLGASAGGAGADGVGAGRG